MSDHNPGTSPIRFGLAGMLLAIAVAAFFLAYLDWIVGPFVAIVAILLALMAVQWPIVWLLSWLAGLSRRQSKDRP